MTNDENLILSIIWRINGIDYAFSIVLKRPFEHDAIYLIATVHPRNGYGHISLTMASSLAIMELMVKGMVIGVSIVTACLKRNTQSLFFRKIRPLFNLK